MAANRFRPCGCSCSFGGLLRLGTGPCGGRVAGGVSVVSSLSRRAVLALQLPQPSYHAELMAHGGSEPQLQRDACTIVPERP